MKKGVHKSKPALTQLSIFPEEVQLPGAVPVPGAIYNNDIEMDGRQYIRTDNIFRERIGKNTYEVCNDLVIERLERKWREQNLIDNI